MNFAEDIISSPEPDLLPSLSPEQRWNSGEFDGGSTIAFDEISPEQCGSDKLLVQRSTSLVCSC